MRSRGFFTSAFLSGLTLALAVGSAPEAAAQCTCDRVIPCGLQISRKWLNENGQDGSVAVGPGASGANSHANRFDFSVGALVTHACFSPRWSGVLAQIHLSGDLGGQPGVAFFSTPLFVTDLSGDPLLSRLQLVELDPFLGGVSVSGLVWVEVEYLNASANTSYQRVRPRTSALGTAMVKQSGGIWTDYDSTFTAGYVGNAPIIRALETSSVSYEVRISKPGGSTTSEAGGTVPLRIRLVGPAPTSDVAVDLVTTSICEGVPFPPRVVFSAGSSGGFLTAIAVGIDDPSCAGDQAYAISGIASSTDPCWNGIASAPAALVNADDETIGFSAPVLYATGTDPRDIVIAELDGDGDLDVATVNRGSRDVSLLRNTGGTGTLAAAVSFSVGGSPVVLAAGNVDGDFDNDIVTLDETTGALALLLNDGAGTFSPSSARSQVIGASARELVLADMDLDGDLDIVAAVSGVFVVSKNAGAGVFGAPVSYAMGFGIVDIAVADFDGDPYLDVAVVGQIYQQADVFLNDGTGALLTGGACSGPIPTTVTAIAAGDIDADGDADILHSQTSGYDGFQSCENTGGGTAFIDRLYGYPAGSDPRDVALGYFGNSVLDAVIVLRSASLLEVVNGATGAPVATIQTTRPPVTVALGYLNFDGLADVVALHGSPHNAVSVALTSCQTPGPAPLRFFGPSPAIAPGNSDFLVTAAAPGATVRFAAALQAGSTATPCAGLFLDLRNAKVLRDVMAEPCGSASLQFFVPPKARGKTVRFQAADLTSCRKSNVVTVTFP